MGALNLLLLLFIDLVSQWHWKKGNNEGVVAYSILVSQIGAFAAIRYWERVLFYFGKREHGLALEIIAACVACAVSSAKLLLTHVLRSYNALSGTSANNMDFLHHIWRAEDMLFALSCANPIWRVSFHVLYGISRHPGGHSMVVSEVAIVYWLSLACCYALLHAAFAMWRHKYACPRKGRITEYQLDGKMDRWLSQMRALFAVNITFHFLAFSQCLLQWVLITKVQLKSIDLHITHLINAFFVCFLGLAVVVCAARSSRLLGQDYLKELMDFVGLTIGVSLMKALGGANEAVIRGSMLGSTPICSQIILSLVLAAAALPGWRMYVVPLAVIPAPVHSSRGSLSSQEEEDSKLRLAEWNAVAARIAGASETLSASLSHAAVGRGTMRKRGASIASARLEGIELSEVDSTSKAKSVAFTVAGSDSSEGESF